MKPIWKIEDLKEALKREPKVRHWVILEESLERQERYLMRDVRPDRSTHLAKDVIVDQDRLVDSESITLRIAVEKSADRQGEAEQKLFPALDLKAQLQEMIAQAEQTDFKVWDLAPPPETKSAPSLRTSDPKITEDLSKLMGQLTTEVADTVRAGVPSRFDSAEIFGSALRSRVHFSNGFDYRTQQSRLYLESAFSSGADEYLNRRWQVGLEDGSFRELLKESAEFAKLTESVETPPNGRISVLLHADVLMNLFAAVAGLLTGHNRYHGLPSKAIGAPLIEKPVGDKITLSLDPTLDYSPNTCWLSLECVEQKPIDLVVDNQVLNHRVSKRYADYLGVTPTTETGALVVSSGKTPLNELRHLDDRVLEVLQFSALFLDPYRATFSSEIRLGRLYDKKTKTVKAIKGGCVAFSLFEDLRDAVFSKERMKACDFDAFTNTSGSSGTGYWGPAALLARQVSVGS